MLNRYPLWKYLLILFVISLGVVYSLPNLYSPDPAVQIVADSSSTKVDGNVLARAKAALTKANIDIIGEEQGDGSILIRLKSSEDQLAAKTLIQDALGFEYVAALNLAPTTPQWLANLGAEPMKLGLDLSGGVHFLLQVDTDAAVKKRLETTVREMKRKLRSEKVRYKTLTLDKDLNIIATFKSEELRSKAKGIANTQFRELTRQLEAENAEELELIWRMSDAEISKIEDYAVSQNLTTLRNRVNELGVSEPIVQRQGRDRIIVELPGIQDTASARRIIGKTASLEFRLEARPDALGSSKQVFEFRNPDVFPRSAELERRAIIKGENVIDAFPGFDQNGQSMVNITLDSRGGSLINRATAKNINRRMGVLFIEYKTKVDRYEVNEDGERVAITSQKEERKLISLPVIRAALGVKFVIEGLDSPQEASELSLLLRAGALAAPMYFIEERTIGPSLGADNIEMGVKSVILGLSLVLIFMLAYYRIFGFAANLALTANILLLIGAMSILGATLTLPGIAGIVLTVGMAVDANVLIFSRIKEELKAGHSPQQAIHSGFDRAFLTIIDANITTLLVAIILYAVGSGPVQGFAVTLFIGILCSMFTAIMGTRSIVNLIYGGRNLKSLKV